MTAEPIFERRLTEALAAIAHEMPTSFDATDVARRARGGPPDAIGFGGPVRARVSTTRRWSGRGAGALAAASLTAMVMIGLIATSLGGPAPSATVMASPSVAPPSPSIETVVGPAPFKGLAPAWAIPSHPDDVDLLVSFEARILQEEVGHYWFWLFDDGLIVWNSEGGNHGRAPRGALVRQRLTVAAARDLWSWVTANSQPIVGRVTTAGVVDTGGPNILWGGLTVNVDGQRTVATWTRSEVTARLLDPAAWLPASAWEDESVQGYVPSRYAVCTWLDDESVDPGDAMPWVLSPDLGSAVRSSAVATHRPAVGAPMCRAVDADVARAIYAELPRDALEGEWVGPRFNLVVTQPSGTGNPADSSQLLTIDIVPMLPSGDIVCNCG